MTILYRAFDRYYQSEICIQFQSFIVQKETDKSYIIDDYGKKRIICKGNKFNKRYAYLTKEDALYDLQIRRDREIRHLKTRLQCIEQGLEFIKVYDINNPTTLKDWDSPFSYEEY